MPRLFRGFRAALLVVTFALTLTPLTARAHDDGPDLGSRELGVLYNALVDAIAQPTAGTEQVCFNYGGPEHRVCVNDDAFAAAVRAAMPAYERILGAHCPNCDPEKKEALTKGFRAYWKNLRAKALLSSIKLTGWASEMALLYGPSWVIYTAATEALEHAVLWWLPPGAPTCMILQGVYFGTAGYVKNATALATNRFASTGIVERGGEALTAPVRELRFQNRLRRLFIPQTGGEAKRTSVDEHGVEEYLTGTAFWGEVHTAALSSVKTVAAPARSGESDITFLFSSAPLEARRWRAYQHSNGVRLLRSILSQLLDTQLEDGRISASDYRAAKKWLGAFGAFLRDYAGNLTAVAGAESAPTLTDAQRAAIFQWRGILRLFQSAREFGKANFSEVKALREELNSMTKLQKAFRKGDFSGLPADSACAADLLERKAG